VQLVADVGGLGHRRDHVIGEVLRVRAGEPDPLQPVDVTAGPQQLAEGEPVAELDPVGVDVLTEQGDLQDALLDQRANLGEDVAGPAVPLTAAQGRDDAEGTGVVAADRDGHPAGVGRLPSGGQRGREDLQGLADLDLGLVVVPRPVQQHRQGADVVGTEHDVDPGRPADDLAPVLLREAAADRDLHAGVGELGGTQVPQVAVEPVVRVLAYRAGVEHHDVRCIVLRRADVTGVLQQPGDPFRVVHVHLAPVRHDLVASRHARRAPFPSAHQG
jgi:hypothetical protein